MKKDTIVGILFAIACIGMLTLMGSILAEADEGFSEDYQRGLMAGADVVGSARAIDGMLDTTYLMLTVLDKDHGNVAINTFCGAFVDGVAEGYNDQVREYNDMIPFVNEFVVIVLGDDAEDYLLEDQPYYWG